MWIAAKISFIDETDDEFTRNIDLVTKALKQKIEREYYLSLKIVG